MRLWLWATIAKHSDCEYCDCEWDCNCKWVITKCRYEDHVAIAIASNYCIVGIQNIIPNAMGSDYYTTTNAIVTAREIWSVIRHHSTRNVISYHTG